MTNEPTLILAVIYLKKALFAARKSVLMNFWHVVNMITRSAVSAPMNKILVKSNSLYNTLYTLFELPSTI